MTPMTSAYGRVPETPRPNGRSRHGRAARPPAWTMNVAIVDRERLLRGWTQRQLAQRAGVDPGTLSDLLGQRRRPTLGTVHAICTSLELKLSDVIVFESGGDDAFRKQDRARVLESADVQDRSLIERGRMITEATDDPTKGRRERRRAWARGTGFDDLCTLAHQRRPRGSFTD
jgi:transcriptional regulator with XRE-family HTH domain